MADDAESEIDRSEWLLAPVEPGEVRVSVELGEGAELTPEVQEMLETLMADVSDAEVEGFAFRRAGLNVGLFGGFGLLDGTCGKLVCDQHDCSSHRCNSYKSAFYRA
jgi:hypothetical protein